MTMATDVLIRPMTEPDLLAYKALRDASGELGVPRETLDRLTQEAIEAHDR